jgi:hypothetical protein
LLRKRMLPSFREDMLAGMVSTPRAGASESRHVSHAKGDALGHAGPRRDLLGVRQEIGGWVKAGDVPGGTHGLRQQERGGRCSSRHPAPGSPQGGAGRGWPRAGAAPLADGTPAPFGRRDLCRALGNRSTLKTVGLNQSV